VNSLFAKPGDHVHVILLGVGGDIYIPHILVPLKSLGLDLQRVKKLALKLDAHVLLSILPTFIPIRRGLLACLPGSACNPPDPH